MPILRENSSIESNYIHGHILSLIIHTNRLKKLECYCGTMYDGKVEMHDSTQALESESMNVNEETVPKAYISLDRTRDEWDEKSP